MGGVPAPSRLLFVLLVLLLGAHHAAMSAMVMGDGPSHAIVAPLSLPVEMSSVNQPLLALCGCREACPLTQARVPEPAAGVSPVVAHGWARVPAGAATASLRTGRRMAPPRIYTARAYCVVLGVFRI